MGSSLGKNPYTRQPHGWTGLRNPIPSRFSLSTNVIVYLGPIWNRTWPNQTRTDRLYMDQVLVRHWPNHLRKERQPICLHCAFYIAISAISLVLQIHCSALSALLMALGVANLLPLRPLNTEFPKPNYAQFLGSFLVKKSVNLYSCESHIRPVLAALSVEEMGKIEVKEGKPRFKWVEIGPNITEAQKQAISELPPKMTNRCKALMRQIICYSYQQQNASLSDLLGAWVRIMKPRRTEWLAILKQLNKMGHPLYFQVLFALFQPKSSSWSCACFCFLWLAYLKLISCFKFRS